MAVNLLPIALTQHSQARQVLFAALIGFNENVEFQKTLSEPENATAKMELQQLSQLLFDLYLTVFRKTSGYEKALHAHAFRCDEIAFGDYFAFIFRSFLRTTTPSETQTKAEWLRMLLHARAYSSALVLLPNDGTQLDRAMIDALNEHLTALKDWSVPNSEEADDTFGALVCIETLQNISRF